MKIDDQNVTGTSGSQVEKSRESQSAERVDQAASSRSRRAEGGDEITLSNLAGRLTQALGLSAAARAERVQHLAEDFQAGRYAVRSQELSRSIVSQSIEGQGASTAQGLE